tara:strand:+ start:947 stop:1753 length:807 start_codon:yes stop_codon:yes gene_type:complete
MKSNWKKYNGSLIAKFPPHKIIKENKIEINQKIKESDVLFARWITDFDSKSKTSFWYVINDKHMELSDYSSNTRNQIKKGLLNFSIKLVPSSVILKNGYNIYQNVFREYNSILKIKSKAKYLESLKGNYEFWGVFYKNKLVGYSQNKIKHNACDYSTIKISRKYNHKYASYALFFTMNSFYLKDKKLKYVSDGARSILHKSNIQDFLIKKFKFRRAYCLLNVMYHPHIKIFVEILYPFRKIFNFLPFDFFRKLSIVLRQEALVRNNLK